MQGQGEGAEETAAAAKEQARAREQKLVESAKQRMAELSEQLEAAQQAQAQAEADKADVVAQTKGYVAKLREASEARTKDLVQKVCSSFFLIDLPSQSLTGLADRVLSE